VQIGDNRAAEWVRRSNPVALGLLFSGLAGQQCFIVCFIDKNKIDSPVSLVVFSKITFWIISDEVVQS
jgi:hypothetical protein